MFSPWYFIACNVEMGDSSNIWMGSLRGFFMLYMWSRLLPVAMMSEESLATRCVTEPWSLGPFSFACPEPSPSRMTSPSRLERWSVLPLRAKRIGTE